MIPDYIGRMHENNRVDRFVTVPASHTTVRADPHTAVHAGFSFT